MARDKERQKINQKRHRDRLYEQLAAYLLEHPCVDCGELDIVVLQFDHLPEFDKGFEIGRAITGSTRSWDSVMAEIAKCEVVCANCHTRRTAARSGWRKWLQSQGTYISDPTLYEKKSKHRVEHGGGVKGRRDCPCELCRAKKKEYDDNWHKKAKEAKLAA